MGNVLNFLCPGRVVKPAYRPIVPNHMVDESINIKKKAHPNHGYSNNSIKTTRYSIITFLPKNLFEQFHRFANIYFIFVVALNWIPQVQAFAKEVAALPVMFVLSVTALKDAFEDFRRYRSDKKINRNTCRVFSTSEKRYVKTEWCNIHAGDFVHLSCNEIIPADILFIRSSDKQGICHIETSNIDGESNLKQRQVIPDYSSISEAEGFEPTLFKYTVQVDQPNSEIYSFKGFIRDDETDISLNSTNLLLRGCKLKNTDFIEGLVLYAGAETKAMLNNKGPRYKISQLESKINRDVIWCVILLLFLCFFCAIGSGIWLADYNNLTDNTNLVPFIAFGDLDMYSPLYQGFLVFWTYIIIFQSVIPLPLYFSMELVKLGQIYFIMQDLELYDESTDKPMECRALNITEDLGQIEYVFSDKTGTLTENIMEFKSCTVGGVNYLHLPVDNEFDSRSDLDSRHSTAGISSMSRSSSIMDNLNLEPALQRELSNMCMRSLSSVELTMPPHVKRVQEFFLLMAVCNTVVVSYHHEDAMDDSGFVAGSYANPPSIPLAKDTGEKSGRVQASTPSSQKSHSLLSLSASESEFMSEGSVTGSSFYSIGSNHRMHYEAESPDELALVKAASTYGCKLMRRSPGKVIVLFPGEKEEIEMDVLNILHFDPTRKRMSVIVRNPMSRSITLFVKGADASIMSVLHRRYEDDPDERRTVQMTQEHLNSYAMKGLRTLCMAKKELSEAEYSAWLVNHKQAEASMDDRDGLLLASCNALEKDLELLGATGIEDKLQEGVPSTISNLRKAGMKVWVLTGDKQETAIQIAHACHLISEEQPLIILNADSKEATEAMVDETICQLRRDFHAQDEISRMGSQISLFSRSITSLHSLVPDKLRNYALVINGPTLNFAVESDLERKFLTICAHCHSVVVCRATPIQKATVVKLVRDNLKKMTLAIGDGANDVSMIQTADIGIGISGQEGMQAVMASDFAIAKFRFLERLLLVHGHWNYNRLALFAAIMFYKSLLSVLVLFWFQIFSGFSGSLMIDSLYLTMQHVIFTAAPPLMNGIFDKDLVAETLIADPALYKPGQRGDMYTTWTYLFVLLDGIWQSLVIYFLPHLAYQNHAVGLWEFGTTIDVCMILVILLHMCIETNSWVWLQWGSIVLSFVLFWSFLLISNAIFFTFDHPSNPYWVMENTIATAMHSTIVIVTCFVSLLPRLLVRTVQVSIFPNEIGVARRREKEKEMELLGSGLHREGEITQVLEGHEGGTQANTHQGVNGLDPLASYSHTSPLPTPPPHSNQSFSTPHYQKHHQGGRFHTGAQTREGRAGPECSSSPEGEESSQLAHNVSVIRQRSRDSSGLHESVIT